MQDLLKPSKKKDNEPDYGVILAKGLGQMIRSPAKIIGMIVVIYLCVWAVNNPNEVFAMLQVESTPILRMSLYAVFITPIILLVIYAQSAPKTPVEKFMDIKFTNKAGNTPQLLKKSKDKKDKRIEIFEYKSVGIPLSVWLQRRDELESTLDCSIISIRESADSKQEIILKSIAAKYAVPDIIQWEDSHISDKDFVLSLGEGLLGEITVDLNKLPHAIIGGTTGSGKSVVLRALLWQSIVKGAKIYIVDFKGGVEFDQRWEDFAEVVTERDRALEILKTLAREMWERLNLFRSENCKNISDYNRRHPSSQLCRIVLGCDELAEMIDKEGITDKEEKALLAEIEHEMATLARLSRAAGIHMILGMQRPDAKILKGQIKNNSPIRVCGRAEPVLSEIVLGNPKASQITNEQVGRFFCNIGGLTAFQGYWFEDEKALKDGNYLKGSMLTTGEKEVVEEEEKPKEKSKAYKTFEKKSVNAEELLDTLPSVEQSSGLSKGRGKNGKKEQGGKKTS